jgi:energy-converting hydrogenase Eha subunit E
MRDEQSGNLDQNSVEAVVRKHLSDALGGARGMVEAAVPTIGFTLVFLVSHELKPAVYIAVAMAAVMMVIRLIQRSSVQFVVNAFFGIALGAFFAWRAARGGGDHNEQALAYFLPGLLYNAVYAVAMMASVLAKWPLVGFMVGAVTNEPTEWRRDAKIVRLCSNLTWVLAAPCIVRVAVQTPIYLSGRNSWVDPDVAIAVLATSKLVMGWPLQIAALAVMVWLLSRNSTPMDQPESAIWEDN